MPKKSKRQRKKENLAKLQEVQTKSKDKQRKVGVKVIGPVQLLNYEELKEEKEKNELQMKLEEIGENRNLGAIKLIEALILLNPCDIKEGDIVIEGESQNKLYYSNALSIDKFKKLVYPLGYKYQFSGYPLITSEDSTSKSDGERFILKVA